VQWLSKAEARVTYPHHQAVMHFFLSMAYQRLDRHDEARTAYQQALGYLEQGFGSRDRYQPGRGGVVRLDLVPGPPPRDRGGAEQRQGSRQVEGLSLPGRVPCRPTAGHPAVSAVRFRGRDHTARGE
jgi:hypothetical protein